LMVVLESVGSITPLECVIASVGAKAWTSVEPSVPP
jgi:hypothetical protein